MALGAKQTGNLQSHLRDTLHVFKIGIFPGDVTPCVETVELLAQIGAFGVFHERHVSGLCQCEQELTLASFCLGHLRGLIDNPFGQTGQVVGSKPYFIGVQLLKHILPELGGQFRKFRAKFFVFLPVGTFKVGTRQCE